MAQRFFSALLYIGSGMLALSMLVSLIAFDGNPFKDAGSVLVFWSIVYGFYMAAGVYSFLRAGNVLWEILKSLSEKLQQVDRSIR